MLGIHWKYHSQKKIYSFIDEGKEISFDDEHCSKDLEPTKSKEERDSNVTFSKEEQLAKEIHSNINNRTRN